MNYDIKVVRMHKVEAGKLKAIVDIAIGDFIIKGFRVVEGTKGLFLSMPQEKAKDGKWYSSVFPVTLEAKKELADAVLAYYQE